MCKLCKNRTSRPVVHGGRFVKKSHIAISEIFLVDSTSLRFFVFWREIKQQYSAIRRNSRV